MAHRPVNLFLDHWNGQNTQTSGFQAILNPNTWVTDSTSKDEVLLGGLLTTLNPEKCTVVGAIDWYAGIKLAVAG